LYRTLLGILAVFAGVLVILGFTFSQSTDGRADFRFASNAEPKTLDPALMTGETEGRLGDALFEGLTRYDAKTMLPAPGVARAWEISADGKTYTFHLRDEARWTDGRPVTASDFVYSWKRLLDPRVGSEYAYIAFPIRYAEAFSTYDGLADSIEKTILPTLARLRGGHPNGVPAKVWQRFLSDVHAHDPLREGVAERVEALFSVRAGNVPNADLDAFRAALETARGRLRSSAAEARRRLGVDAGLVAKDERTLVVELRAPTPYFLSITMFHPFLPQPRWAVERRPDDWFLPEHIVSNGAFRLARWIVGQRIRLERNESYWDKANVRLRTVDALSLEGETPMLNLYLTGAVDWVPKQIPRDLAPLLKERKDLYATPALVTYFYRINCTRKPLDDKRVRRALALSIDRDTIVKNVTQLGELPALTIVPPVLPDYQAPRSALGFRPDEARALLAEAGFPGGKGFPKLGILYNTFEQHKKIAEVIADQLRKNLGIEAQAYNQEWQSYLDSYRNLDYDLARAGWIGDYPDPNTFLDMWVTNSGNNATGWSSPLYDELVRLASDVTPLVEKPETYLPRLREPELVRALLEPARSATTADAQRMAREKLRLLVLREAEAILVEDEFPILPVYFYVNVGLVREYVRGFYSKLEFPDGTSGWNLQEIHPLRDVWIDEGARP
jgi:oligopeptide transport system substrate-binding protein